MPRPAIQRAVPLRDQVLARLITEIHAGRFGPGERLTEGSVATVLGVSRTPVREALGALMQRGVLARRDRGGYVIPTPDLDGIRNAFELRRLLEPYAARRAASRVTPTDIEDLKQALQALRVAAAKGTGDVTAANRALRHKIFALAGNAVLTAAIDQLNDHVQAIGHLTLKRAAVRKIVIARHRATIHALEIGDGPRAERAMHEYLDAAEHAVLETFSRISSKSTA